MQDQSSIQDELKRKELLEKVSREKAALRKQLGVFIALAAIMCSAYFIVCMLIHEYWYMYVFIKQNKSKTFEVCVGRQ